MAEAGLPLESLFAEPHLQGFASDLAQLRTRDNQPLPNHAWLRIAQCVDKPYLAHAEIGFWDTLIVDRKRAFSHYLWPLIQNKAIGKASTDDILTAIHLAAERVREDDARLEQTLAHASFLGPPQDP
jgi:hypothetical protein